MARDEPLDFDPLIAQLPPSLQPLALRGTIRQFRRGTVILEEGSQGDALYLILKGRVKAYSADGRGREVVYGVHGAGEYFGEMSLDGEPRSASVMATEAAICSLVTRRTLRDHIARQPDFAFELLARVIRRARLATAYAKNMALLDVYGRLVHLLDQLAVTDLGNGRRGLLERLTHADLAARVGSSREMISRILKDLERGGYLSHVDGRLAVDKPMPSRW